MAKRLSENHYAAYLSNRTPCQLDVEGSNDVRISLPPLASRYPVSQQQWEELDHDALRKSSKVHVTTWRQASSTDVVQFSLGVGSVVSFLLSWLTWIFYDLVTALVVYGGVLTGFALLALSIGTPLDDTSTSQDATSAEEPSQPNQDEATTTSGGQHLQERLAVKGGGLKRRLTESWSKRDHPKPSQILSGVADTLVPTAVAVIGFGTAMAVSYYVVTGRPMAEVFEAGNVADLASQGDRFILHTLRTLFIGILVTFPAGLYYMFERQRGEALRTRFLLDLFRLDNRMHTIDDVRARYGDRMRDVFGDESDATVVVAKRRGLRYNLPILVSTVVLTVAAVVIYVPLAPGTGGLIAPGGDLTITTVLPFRHILSFALLGAYFYALNLTVRGYVRGDLQPKTYSQVSARILQVLVISAVIWVLYLAIAPDSQATSAAIESNAAWALLLAFFAGVIPDTVLTALFEWLRQSLRRYEIRLGKRGQRRTGERQPLIAESQPLTSIQGVDLYDRARLEQEGVTNLEALVHGELVDLMIQTRIPTGRLVDWMDQAVLLLYTKGVVAEA
jgi:hypothetical protein